MIELNQPNKVIAISSTIPAQSSSEVIRLENVAKTYPGADYPAVDSLSFELKSGELLALLGPSGCGKTTSLRLVAGFERPDQGQILINGQSVADSKTRWQPPEKRGLGVVFQDYALFPHLTVSENITFGLWKLPRPAWQARLNELLKLTELSEFSRRYPHQLSGGQQQRVALARALAPRPLALLLDEAFNSLDTTIRSAMHREVRAILKAEQVAALLVTHDQTEAFELAERLIVLNRGQAEQIGTPQEVYRQPASRFVANFVGRANFLPAQLLSQGVVGRLTLENLNRESDLLVRPHEIELHSAAAETGLAAVVTRRVYVGGASHYTLQLASGLSLEAVSDQDFETGESLKIRFNLQSVNFFPK